MSDSNSNNDNNNGNYFKSSYNTFSKVCRTDPENFNQQICKETINENGKINEKEYIVPLGKNNYSHNEPRKLISRSDYDNNTNTNNGLFNNLRYVISNVFSGYKNDKNEDNKNNNNINKYEFYEENDRDRKKNSNNNNFNRTINEYHDSSIGSNNINFPNFSNTRDSFFSDINDFVKFEGKILKI